MFLERVPDRAVVNESVELVKRARKRSAAPFVNAVLRKLATSAAKAGPDAQPAMATLKRRPTQKLGGGEAQIAEANTDSGLSEASAHPLWLIKRWAECYGFEVARQICIYDQQVPESSIHLHGEEELSEIKLSPGKLLGSARRIHSNTFANASDPRFNRIHIRTKLPNLWLCSPAKGQTFWIAVQLRVARRGFWHTAIRTQPSSRLNCIRIAPACCEDSCQQKTCV